MTSPGASTPKQDKTAPDARSPAPSSMGEIMSPRPASTTDVQPVPVDIPLKELSIYTRGHFATSGKVIRAHDKVMKTTAGSPYFFFVLQDEITCKIAVWQQHANAVAEMVRPGMRLRLVNPSLIPANPNFSFGATAPVELRVLPETRIEITEENLDPVDSTLPLVEFSALANGTIEIGTVVRVSARVLKSSVIFQSDNGVPRSDGKLIDNSGHVVEMTFWGESARLMHEGLESRTVSIGPAKVVAARHDTEACKLHLNSLPRTTLHVQPLGISLFTTVLSDGTDVPVKVEKDVEQAVAGPGPSAQRGTYTCGFASLYETDLSAVFAKIPVIIEEEENEDNDTKKRPGKASSDAKKRACK